MPRVAKKTAAKPAKAAAKKTKSAAAAKAPAKKKTAARKVSAIAGLKLAAKPVAAAARASAATPARVVTRRREGKTEVVGIIGTVTSEEIAMRAYFIAERRRNHGIPGDPQSDWLEAERQLRS